MARPEMAGPEHLNSRYLPRRPQQSSSGCRRKKAGQGSGRSWLAGADPRWRDGEWCSSARGLDHSELALIQHHHNLRLLRKRSLSRSSGPMSRKIRSFRNPPRSSWCLHLVIVLTSGRDERRASCLTLRAFAKRFNRFPAADVARQHALSASAHVAELVQDVDRHWSTSF